MGLSPKRRPEPLTINAQAGYLGIAHIFLSLCQWVIVMAQYTIQFTSLQVKSHEY